MHRTIQILLLVLILVSVQLAALGHQHATDPLPPGQQAAVCDFCTGLQSVAPPPVLAGASHHALALSSLLFADLPFALPSRPSGAHRTRAPPAVHSI